MTLLSSNTHSGNPSDSIFRILSNVIGGGQADGGPFLRLLHGNPEDYVWSTDGLHLPRNLIHHHPTKV